MVEVEVLQNPEQDTGWTVLATTVRPEAGTDTAILQAYQDHPTTVEPGFRGIKNPAAIAPVWLKTPERIAALARLTVIGLLVYSLIQRQVRLYLCSQDQQVPGNKGATATPTAAVVWTLFAQVALVQVWLEGVMHFGLDDATLAVWNAKPIPRMSVMMNGPLSPPT
jgi:hypothetical protein